MSDSKPEKRAQSRIPVNVPATIRTGGGPNEVSAITRDLSVNGIFLYTDRRITEGSNLEIVLILPEELGLGDKQWACCQASVVRVEEEEGHKFGLAATINRLDLLPEIPT
jgi:hypothetical protein